MKLYDIYCGPNAVSVYQDGYARKQTKEEARLFAIRMLMLHPDCALRVYTNGSSSGWGEVKLEELL